MGARALRPALLALGLLSGLLGLRWGLPGAARLSAFPETLKPTPEVAERFARSWAELYRGIEQTHRELKGEEPVTYVRGVEEVPAGWSWPPPKLLNSYRSLLLRSENPDEQKPFVVLSRMRPWRLEFEPLWIHYGGAFIYPLGAFLEAASLARAVRLVSGMGHYLMHPGDMGGLYVAGRLFVLFFHVASLWLLFDLGRRLGGDLAGGAAALLYLLAPLMLLTIHGLKPHPYSAFWLFAAFRYAYLLAEGDERSWLRCGLCAGMAAGSNFSFVVFGALPVVAWLARGPRRLRARAELPRAAAACALAATVFIALNPYVIFARSHFLWETTVYPGKPEPSLREALLLFGPYLARQLGLVPQLLAAAGLWRALRTRAPGRRLLGWTLAGGCAALWAGFAILWGFMSGPETWRFFYPMLGLMCLAAGDLLAALPRRVAAVLLVAVLVDLAPRAYAYEANLVLDDGPGGTRPRAAAWIEANVPDGARLGLSRYPQPATTPVFRYDRYHLVIFERADLVAPARYPDFVLVDEPGRASVEASPMARDFELAAAFRPVELAWGRVYDDSFFANAAMYVYRRRAPAP